MSERPKVLFLCTGNACRSQMAEGWARHLWGETLEASSAGTAPAGLDRRAVEAMAEAGVDIAGHASKLLSEALAAGGEPDLVVTVCDRARQSCPIFPGATRTIHSSFPDPAAATGDEEDVRRVFRRVRDEIRAFVETLPEQLGQGGGAEG